MRLTLTVIALLSSGCASIASDGGRSDVDLLVRDRLMMPGDAPEPIATASDGSAPSEAIAALLAQPLTADSAMRVALGSNARVQASLASLGVARAMVLEARAVSNPRAEAELYFSEGSEMSADLSVVQSITSLLYAGRRSSAALAEVEAAKLDAARDVVEIAFSARRAFLSWQAAAQRAELTRSVLAASDAAYEAARALHASGNFTDLALYGEQDSLERAKIAVHDAELGQAAAKKALDAALGLWGTGAKWTAAIRLPDPGETAIDIEKIERESIERNLGLASLRHSVAALGSKAGLAAVAGWIPDIELGVAAKRESEAQPWAVGPRIEIELPLFYQGAGLSARYEADLLRLRNLYAAEAVDIRAMAASAAEKTQAGVERVRHQRDVVLPLRTRIVEETQRSVNAMSSSIFDLLQARRAEIEAGRDYVDALERYWMARTEVDQLVAGGGARDLSSAPPSMQDTDQSGASSLERRGDH